MGSSDTPQDCVDDGAVIDVSFVHVRLGTSFDGEVQLSPPAGDDAICDASFAVDASLPIKPRPKPTKKPVDEPSLPLPDTPTGPEPMPAALGDETIEQSLAF